MNKLCLLQAQSGSGGLVVSSDEKKREELRWFPADNISDCDAEPGLEQVKLLSSSTNAERDPDHGRYIHYYVTTVNFTCTCLD